MYNIRMSTIFEKIIAKEVPASFVYEDDIVVSFLSIMPINKGHTLVVPRKNFVNIFDADPEILGHMLKVSQKVALALRKSTGAEGVNILMNNEAIAGQEVFHAHLHVIPRFKKGEAFTPAQHVHYADGEMDVVATSIRNAIV